MPELPEVETVRRGLEPVLAGARLRRVVQRRPDLRFPLPQRFVERLEGRTLTRLDRRAKYILGYLDSGEILTIHLGMTGRFSIALSGGPNRRQVGEFTHDAGGDPTHDHVVFETEAGATVTYNDARRFGYMSLVPAAELATHPHFKSLGVEPLGPELTPAFLARKASGRTADLKAFLMDQRIIAGLGNIYVCEALYRSGLNPGRPASVLARASGKPTQRCERLVVSIREVLEAAIAAGGSTLRDYRHTDGSLGYFQHAFSVYGREDQSCRTPGCAGTVTRMTQGGRSTFYCGRCQR
ncbi:MAG: bifunctional DNA-formamidopyrimidine glycosylase/DNA-(apurinic or apyrimidinic site) lyase [Hyphomicrobiaceae bacterium]